MVWGMMLPSGFGDFWPGGWVEYDPKTRDHGWIDRLRRYYLEQSPEEQRRLFDYGEKHVGYGAGNYGFYAINKFINEIGTKASPDKPILSPIEPHEVPQFYRTEKSHQSLASFIQLSSLGWAVDDALKAIIERLEPGVHQFFPIEIRMPRGRVYPVQYFIFVVGQYIESFSFEESRSGSCELDITRFRFEKTRAGISGLAFRKIIFNGAKLWRERRLIGTLTCFSDELQAEIASAGLRIPKYYKMMEV